MSTKIHWETVFEKSGEQAASWYLPHLHASLRSIQKTGLPSTTRIIDVGGGDSTLVDDLIELGFENLTVLDISSEALTRSQLRLGKQSQKVKWIEADIEHVELRADHYEIWHDRALFHFLTTSPARSSYLNCLRKALRNGGYAIMSTFADDGPAQCSGLPVERYSPQELRETLGDEFSLIEAERIVHLTPNGTEQRFIHGLLQKTIPHEFS